jgi:hypothetical protein
MRMVPGFNDCRSLAGRVALRLCWDTIHVSRCSLRMPKYQSGCMGTVQLRQLNTAAAVCPNSHHPDMTHCAYSIPSLRQPHRWLGSTLVLSRCGVAPFAHPCRTSYCHAHQYTIHLIFESSVRDWKTYVVASAAISTDP